MYGDFYAIGLRPWIRRMRIRIIATTKSTWIKPPIVYDVKTPKSHKMIKMIAIV